jgi:Type ISP C-terminal specificity domain/N-6 DNA Methylase
MSSLAQIISEFGEAAKSKLNGTIAEGGPESQLGNPLEQMVKAMGQLVGLADGAVELVNETPLNGMQTRPDFAVTVNGILAGYIEMKAPGKGFDPSKYKGEHDKAQWGKLKSLPNILYTDGNGFSLWHNGECDGKPVALDGDIETSGAKLSSPNTLTALFTSFLLWQPDAPKSVPELAKTAARLCRLLRDEVLEHLQQGHGTLKQLHTDWRALLFPNAEDAQFADGYAQAVTFGLLMARAQNIPLDEGVELAAVKLKKSNTLIGTALNLLTQSEDNQKILSTSLNTMTRVLHKVDWATISKGNADAWLYFYEDFLAVYDNTLRKRTGSYYTPPEVVNAMVRLVDEALKSPLFDRPAGLASPDVTIADPAVGTGTFLLGVLRKIAENAKESEGGGTYKGAVKAAAKRLFGFELQFGPFAVAQLRLQAEMRALLDVKTGDVPDVNLYITDTLGNPFVEDEYLPQTVEAIAVSRREANKVKRGQPITVVIGNPPYKNQAAGLGGWIESGSDGRAAPLAWWSPPVEWGLGAHTHHLKNLYIFFWRWATLKVFGTGWSKASKEEEIRRPGIICFITAAGFLNGPAFARMREDLRQSCSRIWVIDCSPEGHQPDVPTRIFQGVQQPVCIVLAASSDGENRVVPAELYCTRLPTGSRKAKFSALDLLSITSSDWVKGPSGWRDPLMPKSDDVWASFLELATCFSWSGSGVTPHRIWPIAPDKDSLNRRWAALFAEKNVKIKSSLFQPDRDRDLDKAVKVNLGNFPHTESKLAENTKAKCVQTRYSYRSFDRQWIIADHRLLSMARPTLWDTHSNQQVFGTAIERSAPKSGPAITFTELLPDGDHYKGSFGGRVYPLWANAEATQSNIRAELLELLADTFSHSVSPEDVMAYIAAVMAHPAFTARFAKDLIRPGLRLPLTADAKLFAEAVVIGREVIWLHSYGERYVDVAAGRPKGAPRMEKSIEPTIPEEGEIPSDELPDSMSYDAGTRRLHVGKGFVANVSPEMWNYDISGKQVVWQWFSYRRKDRSKPIIGDRRPPSPLEQIKPDGWLPEYTTDLLNLLRVLGRVTALEPAQAALLDKICTAKLITKTELQAAGLMDSSEETAED